MPKSTPPKLEAILGIQEYPVPKDASCVYFLCDADDIVYVGATTCLEIRTRSHLMSQKYFSRVYYIQVPKEDLFNIERKYIKLFNPIYNLTPNNHSTYSIRHKLAMKTEREELRRCINEAKEEMCLK